MMLGGAIILALALCAMAQRRRDRNARYVRSEEQQASFPSIAEGVHLASRSGFHASQAVPDSGAILACLAARCTAKLLNHCNQ